MENKKAVEIDLDKLVIETIPIYTIKRPDPKTGKKDCNLVKSFKEGRRLMMKKRLEEAGNDQNKIKAIIERYARTEQ